MLAYNYSFPHCLAKFQLNKRVVQLLVLPFRGYRLRLLYLVVIIWHLNSSLSGIALLDISHISASITLL